MLSLDQALAELGDTADGIAETFTARGIKGVPGFAACRPIANYLTGAGFEDVEVDPSYLYAYLPDHGSQHVTKVPEGVVEFIERFDDGDWPELIDEPEVADV